MKKRSQQHKKDRNINQVVQILARYDVQPISTTKTKKENTEQEQKCSVHILKDGKEKPRKKGRGKC